MACRIQAVINTHDGYLPILGRIKKSIRGLIVPGGVSIDVKTVVGESFNNFPDKTNKITHFSKEHLQQLVDIRNKYLEEAFGYDWLLHVDGDIIPPRDGLVKLFAAKKKYIGGWAHSKKGDWKYVLPDKIRGEVVYDCEIIGNMFLLEHKDLFSIKYKLFTDKANVADCAARCRDIRVAGDSCWVHSGVKCEHL